MRALAVVLALLLFGAGYFFLPSRTQAPQEKPDATIVTATSSLGALPENNQPPPAIPKGAKEYRSNAYKFSLLYPENLSVDEHDEGGGAATITFQDVKTVEGFQIFIVPYTGAQVSDERFKQDEPSGVRNSLITTYVDGAVGAAFYSVNSNLGETREVWFIRGGFLYEVTTLKLLTPWLDSILKTWKFS